MSFNRYIKSQILEKLQDEDSKIIVIYGPRQIGKTTLANEIIDSLGLKTLKVNADQDEMIDIFSSQDFKTMNSVLDGYELLFLDEAQRIPNIGLNLKILFDEKPDLKIITTGSSSFELANRLSEPLTGRKWTFNLYPISFLEFKESYNEYETKALLDEVLVYGSYPEIFKYKNINDKAEYLQEIFSSYLYKDVLQLETIKHARKIDDLLRLLAFQIGSEVSINELASQLQLSTDTVNRYIDLLEKSFVIFRLTGFSRNLRKEVSKKDKIYFWDLGIRNLAIKNLNPVEMRNDIGQLFENFLIAERMKYNRYTNKLFSSYFWRTYTGAEVDYVEEGQGELFAYEFKYSKSKAKLPLSWKENYGDDFQLINKDNFLKFIS